MGIEARCLEDFNVEKLKHVQAAKAQIRGDYAAKVKAAETAAAISRSAAINKARLQKNGCRHTCLGNVKTEVSDALAKVAVAGSKQYSDLLCALIVQGCLKLSGEDTVTVKCRKEDESIL